MSNVLTYQLHSTDQSTINQWLAKRYENAHGVDAVHIESFLQKILGARISRRNHYFEDYIPSGAGEVVSWQERMNVFSRVNEEAFAKLFDGHLTQPDSIYHVSFTGYESPSAVQSLAQKKGWGQTQVTHLYHMGCYAALIAVRQAWNELRATANRKVTVVHTEACSLHANFESGEKEQMIVNSLFSDGVVKYDLTNTGGGRRLVIKQCEEYILPNTESLMSWKLGNHNLSMTLSREVPKEISKNLKTFVNRFEGRDEAWVFAVHPGGPSIIDAVGDSLGLSDLQLAMSRDVFYRNGNMSSATLPYIWKGILEQKEILPGTKVLSLAFGPGLTVCGTLFEVAE